MQFRARLAQVNGTSPRSEDSPNVIAVKLEPTELLEADWLFGKLGCYLVVELFEAPPQRTPIEEAIAAAVDDDDLVVPSNGRRRNGTRSSEQA
jgi:hypothetical protein